MKLLKARKLRNINGNSPPTASLADFDVVRGRFQVWPAPVLEREKMDTGLGELEPVSNEVAKAILRGQEKTGDSIPSVFRLDEILEIKGSKFRIIDIGRRDIKLRII